MADEMGTVASQMEGERERERESWETVLQDSLERILFTRVIEGPQTPELPLWALYRGVVLRVKKQIQIDSGNCNPSPCRTGGAIPITTESRHETLLRAGYIS